MSCRSVAWSLAVGLVIAACGGTSGSETTLAPSSTISAAPTSVATHDTSSEDPIQTRVDRALDAVLDAGSYAFEIAINVTIAGSSVETELEGWVDGPDRRLLMRSGGNEVIVRVVDLVATVERDGQITEVPLEQVDEPPSLELLRSLHQATVTSPGVITGVLNASLLRSSGIDNNGAAAVTLHLSDAGALAGYEMSGQNGNWTITARFFDLGESFAETPPA